MADYLAADDKQEWLEEMTARGSFYQREGSIVWSEFFGEEIRFPAPACGLLDLKEFYGLCMDDAGILPGENQPLYACCSLYTDYYSDLKSADAIVDLCTGTLVLLQEDAVFSKSEDGYYYTSFLPADLLSGRCPCIDPRILEAYEASISLPAMPEDDPALSDLRSAADALAQRFGITILLPQQCSGVTSFPDYAFTDSPDSISPEIIRQALDVLDQELTRYPEDFFLQFTTPAGDLSSEASPPGLRILLTGSIRGDVAAAGLTNASHRTIDLALNITDTKDLPLSIHHEMGHAMDLWMTRSGNPVYNESIWNQQNPEGFVYSGGKESYELLTAYTFTDDTEPNVYFYDPYARTSPQEDRARLLECAACPKLRSAEQFFSCEHPQKKLALFCRAIRETFDTSTWKEPPFWERFLMADSK